MINLFITLYLNYDTSNYLMNIPESIFDAKLIPEYVNVNNINLLVGTNVKDLNLLGFFDSIDLATTNMQMIRYGNNLKYSNVLTKSCQRIVKRFNECNLKGKNLPYFKNAITFFSKKNCYKLFKNGQLMIIGKPNISNMNKYIKIIFKLIENYANVDEVKILDVKICSLNFNIKLSSICIDSVTQKLLSNGYVKKPHLFIKADIFESNNQCIYIFKDTIVGWGYKSPRNITKLFDLIKEFVELKLISGISNETEYEDYIFNIDI